MTDPAIHNAQRDLVDAMRRLQIVQIRHGELFRAHRQASTDVTKLTEEVDRKRIALEKAIADDIEATRSERT